MIAQLLPCVDSDDADVAEEAFSTMVGERDRLTASTVHQAVDYRPITRYDVIGGYTNVAGLAGLPDVFTRPPAEEDTP